MNYQNFQKTVWEYYHSAGRNLPWRNPEPNGVFDAYKILVSEIMLQQTQAARVVPKYHQFLQTFPTISALAEAPLSAVLSAWSGLGYNRRAKYLHEAAKILSQKPQPWSQEDLVACKGIGPNTAAAVMAYAYDEPVMFIETNIRTVFIHHFFKDNESVHDKDILPLVEKTLPAEKGKEQPEQRIHSAPGTMRKTAGLSHNREWYWALMDYGVYLKSTVGNASRASKHYAKQSKFEGSKRQLRGQILRMLGEGEKTLSQLEEAASDSRLPAVLDELVKEQLISQQKDTFILGS